jgi:hypothetical protein
MNTMFILAIAALLAVLSVCLLPGVFQHNNKNTSHRSMSRAGFRPLSPIERLASPFVQAVHTLSTGWRSMWAPTRLIASNIAEGVHDATVTRLTDAAITTRHLLYKQGSDAMHVAVITGASDLALGTIADEAAAAEEVVTLKLLGKGETTRMVSDGTVVAGAAVYQTAAGKVANTGTIIVGIALTDGGTDGDVVEVADVNASANAATPGIPAATLDANTILFATSDNTPAALPVAASRIVGRKASGNIDDMTGAEARTVMSGVDNITATPVAAAGSTVADAGQLAASAVVLITSDGATKGVKLPTGVAGMVIDVINGSATACELYAASGGTVNGLSADASVVVPASKGLRCFCTAADTWIAYDLPAKATAS